MIDYSIQNKKAWEYNAYDFWVKHSGSPSDMAKRDLENPIGKLKKYCEYFDIYDGINVANICGSCGKKAVPLAILGAEVLSLISMRTIRNMLLRLQRCKGQFEL